MGGSFSVGGDEEKEPEEVDAGDREVAGAEAVLGVEDDRGDGVGEFFEPGGDHELAITRRTGGDDHEGGLPGESGAGEAVIEEWVRDGRRVFDADGVEDEKERSEDQHAPDAGGPVDDFGEFYVGSGHGLRTVW